MALGCRAQCVWCDKGNAVGIYPRRRALTRRHFRGAREVSEESDIRHYWRKHAGIVRVVNSLLRGCKPYERETR